MAAINRIHLAAVCTAVSCIYLVESLDRHSLTGRPRLSSILVLFLSGIICLLASHLPRWIPHAAGRYTGRWSGIQPGGLLSLADRDTELSHASATMADRPRRYFLPLVVSCVAIRLELFHRVNSKQQCSTPGIESFLCSLLFCHEIFATRRKWAFPTPDDPDDPWRSIFDDLYDWFSGPRVTMTMAGVSILVISLGTYLSSAPLISPAYFCFDLVDSQTRVLFLQLLGLGLDAAIIVFAWRILSWLRATKIRLHTLGIGLMMSSLATALVWLALAGIFGYESPSEVGSRPLYGFDILLDSAVFTVFLLSATAWVCSTSPLLPSAAITTVLGFSACTDKLLSWGDWLHFESEALLAPLWLISGGSIFFLYFQDAKYLFFLRRALLVLLMVGATIGTTIYTSHHRQQTFDKRHPITELMHRSQVTHDLWARNAHISESLSVAVATYEERHPGQAAPPYFSEWYEYAKETTVIDDFEQIKSDLDRFRSLKPELLREGVQAMAALPDVLTINIKDGKVTHGPVSNDQAKADLGDLVTMISKFSEHLPDMTLPINLDPTPRILPSWDTAQSSRILGSNSMSNMFSKRSLATTSNSTLSPLEVRDDNAADLSSRESITPNAYRQMQIEACSPLARARTTPQWGSTQFCPDCIKRHSKGSLLTSWKASMKTCSQSDLKYLHGLYLSSPRQPPVRELLPLFSFAKTDSFSDILMPLPRLMKGGSPDVNWKFSRRYDTLFWKGNVGQSGINDDYLRGSQKLRLLHLLEDPGPQDEIVLILPVARHADRFTHEKIGAREASSVAPFNVQIGGLSACETHECEILRKAYGSRLGDSQETLEYRYVLLLDEDDGPPKELVRTLRSNSVPFVSTIFRSWYTERIQPWLHFVPVDVRFQALHTSYLYFTGTENRAKINGRDTKMKGRLGDAEWIAHEGRKWADKALGDRDMEAYMFRLLLEWGRLIDDQRDKIGFWRSNDGGFDNIGFSKA